MSYEDRIRRGLKKAGWDGNGWIELLALNMLPDPGHDLSGKRAIWKFSCPKWLGITIFTGRSHKWRHSCLSADLGQPGFLLVYGHRNKSWKLPVKKIIGITFSYSNQPDIFYKGDRPTLRGK